MYRVFKNASVSRHEEEALAALWTIQLPGVGCQLTCISPLISGLLPVQDVRIIVK
jgi:hypothetical protein